MKVTRRHFLQISGGAAACTVIGISAVNHQEQPKNGATLNLENQTFISDEEAISLRHLRHRRQAHDGIINSLSDSYENCEHGCTSAMFAHQL